MLDGNYDLRVLHIANTAGYSSGGIGDVAQQLFRHQRQLGVDATLWFPGGGARAREVEEITQERGDHVCAIPSLSLSDNAFPYGVLRYLHKTNQFDVVHQHGIWLPTSLLTAWVARNVPTIISPHGLLEPIPLKLSSGRKRLVGTLYEKRNLRGARCLSACSLQEADGLRAYGLSQKIAIIPNGVSEALMHVEFDKDREGLKFKRKMGLAPSASVILFLSRLHPIKGIELLISAAKNLENLMREASWLIVIAGDGEANYRKTLRGEIGALGMEDVIRLVGPLYGEQKMGAYAAAEVFALTSYNENFGIVVAEALAMGVPVLTTMNMPWAETERIGCGIIVESTQQGVTQGLRQMIGLSQKARRAMGTLGQEYARRRFSWNTISGEFLEVYRWMMGGKSPRNTTILGGAEV